MKTVLNLQFLATPEDETWPFILLVIAIFVILICCVGNILKLRHTFRKLRKASRSYNVYQPAATLSSDVTVIDMQTINLSEAKSEEAVNNKSANTVTENVEPKPSID